jgi:hypothetical protein
MRVKSRLVGHLVHNDNHQHPPVGRKNNEASLPPDHMVAAGSASAEVANMYPTVKMEF